MIVAPAQLLLPAPGAATAPRTEPAAPSPPPIPPVPRIAGERRADGREAESDAAGLPPRAAAASRDPRRDAPRAAPLTGTGGPASGGATAFAAQLFAQTGLGQGLHIEPWRSGIAAYARSAALVPEGARSPGLYA